MKVHILFATDEITNGRVVGVYTNKSQAQKCFRAGVQVTAMRIGDPTPGAIVEKSDEFWSYMPDDTEEHQNVSVTLHLDCEVTA